MSPAAARGLIKLAIIDEFGPFKPVNQLKYYQFISVIQNSLKNRLIDLDIVNYTDIVNVLIDELTRNQSLFTMAQI